MSISHAHQVDGLLERHRELGQLAIDLACAGRAEGRVALICGPAGIGKTALLAGVHHQAEAAGMLVLRARGVELEQGFAFGVVRQLFEPVLLGAGADERSRLLSGPAGPASVVFGAAAAPDSGSEYPSFALFHAIYALTINIAERGPIVLLLDDAHWADLSSLRWLSYLAGRMDGLAAAVVVSVRGGDGSAWAPSLDAVACESTTRVMTIEPLSPGASSLLVEREFGSGSAPEFRAACYSATGGNPFFLGELFRAVRAARITPTADGAARVADQGPRTLARSVLLRTAGLSAQARAVARAMAVLGADAELTHIAQLGSLDEAAAAEAAGRLADAQIIIGDHRLSFAHPIVAAAIYADIPSATRTREHARAARVLFDTGVPAERVSAHLLVAAPAADPWAVRVLRQAAAAAIARGAPDSATALLRRALAEPPSDKARSSVLSELGWAEYLAYERVGAVEHLLDAMRLAPNTDERTTLALRTSQVLVIAGVDRSDEAVEILHHAITTLPEDRSQARARLEAELVAAAGLKLSTRPLQRAWLEILHARQLGDSHAERLLLANLVAWTAIEGRVPGHFPHLAPHADKPGSPAQITRQVAERAMNDGQLLKREGPESHLFYLAAMTFCHADWLDQAARWLDSALDTARQRGSIVGFALASAFQAEVAYRLGDLGAAEAHARAAMTFVPGDVTAVLVNTLIDRGELATAGEIIDSHPVDANADHFMIQPVIAARARLHIAQNKHGEAADDLLAVGRWLDRWPIHNPSFVPWRSMLATVRQDPRDSEPVRRFASEEVQHARALDLPRSLGIALRAFALSGSRAESIDVLREATSVLERSQSRLEHARALTDLGAALRRNGNRREARDHLRLAQDIAHRCNATALVNRAHTELLATGARPRRIALAGRDSLTATEQRVADLAAEGHTTRAIAQSLFVTNKTIETHIGHIYQKLGIHTRGEIAQALRATE